LSTPIHYKRDCRHMLGGPDAVSRNSIGTLLELYWNSNGTLGSRSTDIHRFKAH